MRTITAADLFRTTWPHHTTKSVERAANCPWATAKNWVQRRTRPSANTLLKMAQESAELRAELVRLLGEWDADAVEAGAVDQAAVQMGRAHCRQAGPAFEADAAVGEGGRNAPVVGGWDGADRRRVAL